MKKHIIYLIAGIIAGLILGILVSAGGEEKEEKGMFEKCMDVPIKDLVPAMNESVWGQMKNLDDTINKTVDKIDKITNVETVELLYDMRTSILQNYVFIQNQRLLLQNEQIIELLEEIRDK